MRALQLAAIEKCKDAIQELYTKALLNPTIRELIFTDDVDDNEPADVTCSKFYYDKFRKAELSQDTGPYNLSVKLEYWIVDGNYYLRPRAFWEMKHVLEFLQTEPELKDWSYVHSKRPKNVSHKEWNTRRRVWERIQSGDDVSGPHFLIILDSNNFIEVDPARETS
jgi:hypothetical protein